MPASRAHQECRNCFVKAVFLTLRTGVFDCDAVRGTIEYASPEGKKYSLNKTVATLLVRPRGWHLPEKHIEVEDELASASLFDFALYFFHNAQYRKENGSGAYFYLPKLEHY